MSETILEVKNLCKYFGTSRGTLHAVDGISFTLEKGKTLGVVGESGCGKSTLGRTILNLLSSTSGEVYFEGQQINNRKFSKSHDLRQKMQLIFQDPYASLNPRMTVHDTIIEPLLINKICRSREEAEARTEELMDLVGLSQRLSNSYPHELDGGRRQRLGIARALALNPRFIVCDEPVSALDVSIQAQILNLLMDLQKEMGLTYIFITHNLSVVKHISDNIMVMYLGKMVEMAPSERLFENPCHPYTKALLSAIPVPSLEYRNSHIEIIKGEVTSPINPKPGCRFAARCPMANEGCTAREWDPCLVEPDHWVACQLYANHTQTKKEE